MDIMEHILKYKRVWNLGERVLIAHKKLLNCIALALIINVENILNK